MTHTYTINGATCGSCLKIISTKILELSEVQKIESIDLSSITVVLKSYLDLAQFNQKLEGTKYSLSNEQMVMIGTKINQESLSEKPKFIDYIPLIVVFSYITLGSVLLTKFFGLNSSQMIMGNSSFMNMANPLMTFMNNFMGLWFVFFSLFKIIDLQGFADGYSTYDLLAKRERKWGLVFPFLELGLGVAYLTRFSLTLTNILTFLLLSLASIGVIQSFIQKKSIKCSCLGTTLKVPLTTISLLENVGMAFMALLMLIF